MRYLLVNFAHPITPKQLAQIAALKACKVEEINLQIIPVQIDDKHDFIEQIVQIADRASDICKKEDGEIILNLPGLSLAAVLIEYLLGFCLVGPTTQWDHTVLRLCRATDGTFDVAQLIKLPFNPLGEEDITF